MHTQVVIADCGQLAGRLETAMRLRAEKEEDAKLMEGPQVGHDQRPLPGGVLWGE